MKARVRDVLTGLAAIAALAAVIAGLPILLYHLGGSPLPRHLASWHRIAAILSSRDDGTMLLAVIRDCSWLGWLVFSFSALAEAHAAVRGKGATRFPSGGLQRVAARLVALAALTFAATPALTLTASAAVVNAQHGATSAAGAVAATSATSLVTVHTGDCLWSLAQRYLGAGDRYPEIASLNYGREVAAGQVFTNPSLIEPGWVLLIPAGSDTGGVHTDRSDIGGEATGTEAGPSAASQHLGHASADTHYRRRHPAARRPSTRSGGGEGFGSGPGGGRPEGGSGRAGAPVGSAGDEQAGYERSASNAPAGDQLPEIGAFATGALAGSILTSLNVLRRRQRLERRAGRRIPLPDDPAEMAVEQQLRAAATAEAPGTLRDALACLESAITAAGQMLPDIVGLHVTPGVLEVLLSAPAADSPPAPYRISPGRQGMCWQLDPAAGLGAQERGGCHLLPGLFTAGATADGYLLLDLEALQVTGCDGPPDLVDRVITTAATELVTGQWAGGYELILVGCDELEAVGRAEHASSLDEALNLIEARREAAHRRLGDGSPADIRQLRLAAPDDEDWILTILVSRLEPSPGQLQRLIDLAEEGSGGVAALLAGDTETPAGRMAPTVLQLAPDPHEPGEIIANVVPLQIVVRPRVLSAADYRAISGLFRVAADTTDVCQEDQAYSWCAAPPWIPQSAGDSGSLPWAEPPGLPDLRDLPHQPRPTGQGAGPKHAVVGRLQVQILGPFVISGAEEQLQPKQAELVLALALSAPAGLSNSALGNLLGADPDHPKPGDAVRQVITRARRRLGLASDGQEYILHTGHGNYALHPEVSLDWAEFRALTSAGDGDALRTAVALIRGQPFTGSYFWWIDIPLLETVRAELVDTAVTLAELELEVGSPRAAARAARAGLRAEASAEQLWRLLMRAEFADGNLAGVSEAWRSCLDAIEDISPGGDPHPDTEALYQQLTSAARQHAQVRG